MIFLKTFVKSVKSKRQKIFQGNVKITTIVPNNFTK